MYPILSIITFLPLLGGIAILFIPKQYVSAMRWTAFAVACVNVFQALALMLTYSQANLTTTSQIVGSAPNGTFLYNELIPWIPSLGINYSLGVDGISLLLVVLTTLLTLVCIGASFRVEQKVKNYMAFMLLLETGIIGVFLSTNLFLFYIFWEVMLIPAYFLVGSWGGERRIYAAFKFVLYTSVGSLLMLAGIIALGYYHQLAAGTVILSGAKDLCGYTLDLATLLNTTATCSGTINTTVQIWLFLAFAAAFVVKVPFIPFHSWLPDAYSRSSRQPHIRWHRSLIIWPWRVFSTVQYWPWCRRTSSGCFHIRVSATLVLSCWACSPSTPRASRVRSYRWSTTVSPSPRSS